MNSGTSRNPPPLASRPVKSPTPKAGKPPRERCRPGGRPAPGVADRIGHSTLTPTTEHGPDRISSQGPPIRDDTSAPITVPGTTGDGGQLATRRSSRPERR